MSSITPRPDCTIPCLPRTHGGRGAQKRQPSPAPQGTVEARRRDLPRASLLQVVSSQTLLGVNTEATRPLVHLRNRPVSPPHCIDYSGHGNSQPVSGRLTRPTSYCSTSTPYALLLYFNALRPTALLQRPTPYCSTSTPYALLLYFNTLRPTALLQHPTPYCSTSTPYTLLLYFNTLHPTALLQHPTPYCSTSTPYALLLYFNALLQLILHKLRPPPTSTAGLLCDVHDCRMKGGPHNV
ncbi:hypothetical protein EOD39_11543 [Acipenser ruthenus]|uniref:Uncharacterized protein n=1 Tax=Acipenser ruthenus TaxID=7906 RepID=A0A444UNC8_ACIRT|nr:hypothetical protein EOD39_11543 [Acipenser ruthenus]